MDLQTVSQGVSRTVTKTQKLHPCGISKMRSKARRDDGKVSKWLVLKICWVLPAGSGKFRQEQYSALASQTVGRLEFSKILQMCLLMSSSNRCYESSQGQYRQGAGGVERAQPVFRKMGTAEGRYAGGMKKSDGNLLLCKPIKTNSIRKAVEA